MMKSVIMALGVAVICAAGVSLSSAEGDQPNPIPMFGKIYYLNGQVVGFSTDQCVAPFTVFTSVSGIVTDDFIEYSIGQCGEDPNNIL